MSSSSLARAALFGCYCLLCVTAATCGDPFPADGDVAGSYQLVRINGLSVPTNIATGTRILAGGLELHADHSFLEFENFCAGQNVCSVGTMQSEGTWRLSNGQLRLTVGSMTTAAQADGKLVKEHWQTGDILEFER